MLYEIYADVVKTFAMDKNLVCCRVGFYKRKGWWDCDVLAHLIETRFVSKQNFILILGAKC